MLADEYFLIRPDLLIQAAVRVERIKPEKVLNLINKKSQLQPRADEYEFPTIGNTWPLAASILRHLNKD
ncbi:MAG: hypothetical protein IPN39_12370 [Chitinophagaceae bacterium]|nr:hypothetical protein [Chitinophagaceae bacterium]